MIKEHYRLGSTCAILSRSFCNTNIVTDLNEIEQIFNEGIKEIRELERECLRHQKYFTDNEVVVKEKVESIVEKK